MYKRQVFLQAESEVSAINMVYGAAAAGMRAMTSSSSPGTVSYTHLRRDSPDKRGTGRQPTGKIRAYTESSAAP